LNAFITIDDASVLHAARQADRSVRAGRSAPLLGVSLAIKDSYLTKGLITTLGTSVLAAFRPTRVALAVEQLKLAGAVSALLISLIRPATRARRCRSRSCQTAGPIAPAPEHRSFGSSSLQAVTLRAQQTPASGAITRRHYAISHGVDNIV
jgi:mandelamide amidase